MTKHEILLVEDSPEDADLVRRTIDRHLPGQFSVTHKKNIKDAESHIKAHGNEISVVLLDLGLPDTSDGRDTFEHMKEYAPKVPIVVLTGMEDHELALALVREGAEDFVNKGLIHEKPELLRNALEFASCRHELIGDVHKKHQKNIDEKDEIIAWMSGGYSVKM
ncbi:MAG: response regulator [Alphaproteobacteria bacterium]|nr:response regulator [Alphaproteobacteria bacterium]MDE2336730.1 response regulator [Alphaproteobacteria bacterium]